ncbi:lysophospholipid acyltransferase family protein [Methylophilus sp. Leaf414]|uniref:lysophospholipid acyltransferase family protein n=1 Tax=Methylophilus sp. Leaf414 TaxID=1736371 RepID=UPI0006FE5209|nr:lysophospholipid acyltransferase family protein [Methylophilus sp. Leaf414]KQT34097.1 lipid A biosynthesis acyltransferase [Methylophilus sp. Leaf414]
MLLYFCKFIAWLPLSLLHRLGAGLGWLSYCLDRKSNQIAFNNILQSRLAESPLQVQQLMKRSRLEAGKALLETFFIWGQSAERLLPLIQQVHGWETVTEAQKNGKGLIFLTPHLGCFEITSIYYGSQYPITVLYRPPKMQSLSNLVVSGRQKGKVEMAPANASGVRKLLQALKSGQAVGILPDQIPRSGEGEWADFFGKPAYTMSLASKLASKTNAVVVMAFGQRLPDGRGFDIHLKPVDDISTPTLLNQAIERQIAQCPEQYLWQYNRFKQRRYAMHKLEQHTSTTKTNQPD